MIRIVIGGQIGKDLIKKQIEALAGNKLEISIKNDLDAAMAVKNGEADYYVGACETGAGGALAMATALLGSENTVSVSSPSKVMDEQEIINQVNVGKVAFGFTAPTMKSVLPAIINAILNK